MESLSRKRYVRIDERGLRGLEQLAAGGEVGRRGADHLIGVERNDGIPNPASPGHSMRALSPLRARKIPIS